MSELRAEAVLRLPRLPRELRESESTRRFLRFLPQPPPRASVGEGASPATQLSPLSYQRGRPRDGPREDAPGNREGSGLSRLGTAGEEGGGAPTFFRSSERESEILSRGPTFRDVNRGSGKPATSFRSLCHRFVHHQP